MKRSAELLEVVGQIYEAAIEPGGLDRLAGLVANALGSHSGLLSLLERPSDGQSRPPDIVGLPSATENFDENARASYAEHYHGCNVWFERGVRKGFPAIVLSQELVPPDELVRTEWFDYCQRLDTFHVIGAQFHVDGEFSAQFGAQRPRRSKAFADASRKTMSLILPHLQRAMQIQIRLGLCDQFRSITLDLLERLGIAALLLDASRRLLFANSLADRLLDGRFPLRISNGQVQASGKGGANFARLVENAARTSAGKGLHSGGMLHLHEGFSTLRLFIAPLIASRAAFGVSEPAVLVLVGDPDVAAETCVHELSAACGLTRAEGALLSRLLTGDSLAEYARRSGITIETARTHAKRILSKTGYHRQIDLVRAVSSDPLFRLSPQLP